MAMQAPTVTTTALPSMQYSMAPQTMVGTTMLVEPVATRIEPDGMVMEQQAMPAATYGAPTTTYLSGAQPGVMATTTYVQGGGVTMAPASAGGVTSFGSAQAMAPVTYGAPGTVTTISGGGHAVGGAGSATLFDQIDTNKDGVISRAEFAQAVQQ
eukprot:CAMPEP_0172824742 /NCGR_PEP_ID=MMETSP1075-20121228/18208_1 /TAXON_ID=2916 /ORGANISM="Ceratium fusus, Strain PA161109" /LENGTH=154 /DNA_ID=CAMNT_0013666075 /DNA_START=1 /DNA_END=465 /DNA_ORIENTATION=-